VFQGTGCESKRIRPWMLGPSMVHYFMFKFVQQSTEGFSVSGYWIRIQEDLSLNAGSRIGTYNSKKSGNFYLQVGLNLRFRICNGHNSKFNILFLPSNSNFKIRIQFKWIRVLNSDSWWYFFLSFRFLPSESGLQEVRTLFERIRTLDPDLWKVPTVSKKFFKLFVPGSQDYRDLKSVSRGFGPWIRIREGYLHF